MTLTNTVSVMKGMEIVTRPCASYGYPRCVLFLRAGEYTSSVL